MSLVVATVKTTSGAVTLWLGADGYYLEATHYGDVVTEPLSKTAAKRWQQLLDTLIV